MKREAAAAAALLALFALTAWNLTLIRGTVGELRTHVENSQEHFHAGSYEQAEHELRLAIDSWLSPKSHIYISLRHGEIDSITDNFYHLLGHLYDQSPECLGEYEHLLAALSRLIETETPTLGSIF